MAHLTLAQQEEAKNDLLLADIEMRLEQVRQLKSYEPRRLWIQAITALAALFGAGAAVGAVITTLLMRHL